MKVAVISSTGKPLDPTHPARARKLLKNGRAKIYKHTPIFIIQLLDREDGIHIQWNSNVIQAMNMSEFLFVMKKKKLLMNNVI